MAALLRVVEAIPLLGTGVETDMKFIACPIIAVKHEAAPLRRISNIDVAL